jgi:hypothetical protein
MQNNNEAVRLKKQLTPYFPALHEAILTGFRYCQRRHAEDASTHTPRTRASLSNDWIVEHAKRKLTPLGVRVFKMAGRILFEIDGIAIIHFKKLNRKLLSSNYPTLFARQFVGQQELPGIPSALPRLIAGFVPTRDWIGIDGIYVTLPNGDNVDEVWQIDQQPISLPLPESDQNEQRKQKRVRRKGGGNDDPNRKTGTSN